jgi:hypothetical protein
MIRGAVGSKLDALSQATREAKEAKRLLELAHWAGDREAEMAIRQALTMLAAVTEPTVHPAAKLPPERP